MVSLKPHSDHRWPDEAEWIERTQIDAILHQGHRRSEHTGNSWDFSGFLCLWHAFWLLFLLKSEWIAPRIIRIDRRSRTSAENQLRN